eukprot:TRINITY_DN8803_c0_g2_i1.p1 TRINITY_DN8803_c0_g2~~TRINITY_DN8803_c0_g2_i1.p1  ORF type:complete len:562 (-),score=159.03 TRINITY_DN8803_c0_g2_i1:96-1781(-)
MSKSDKTKAYMVKDAYSSFWDNIKFKRGWAKPLFSKEEVDHLLEEAADIVVEIRNGLDLKDPSFKLRMLEGNGREFLWNVLENPLSDPENFVRGLVHATFQDANGYVEGLDKETIDAKITEIMKKKEITQESLHHKWEMLQEKLDLLLQSKKNPKFSPALRKIDNALTVMAEVFRQLEMESSESEDTPQAPTPAVEPVVEPASESTDDSKMEQVEEKAPEGPPERLPLRKTDTQTELSKPANLEILRATNNIGVIRSQIIDLAHASDNLNLDNLVDNPEKGQKIIKDLNKKCLEYTESLMKDLLKLDEVVCNQEQKPLRKAQVQKIQGLMDDVDKIKQKLVTIQNDLRNKEAKKKQKEVELARKNQENKKKELELEQRAKMEMEQKERIERENRLLKEMWKGMKFTPNLKVNESRDQFVISGNIPNMKKEDIKISTGPNNRTLTISGYREPSEEDIAILRKQLEIAKERDPKGQYFPRNEDERGHLMRLGAGRFGSFSETYQIDPISVDLDGITASYEGGILKVTVPKITHRRQNVASPGRYSPFNAWNPSDFYQDNDIFW